MLKQLRLHHRNVLQMSFNGFTAIEIAEKLDLAEVTVYKILNSELGKAYINGLNDKMQNTTLDVRKELISMNRDALSTFKRLLNPKEKAPASVQFNTAKDILDRSGYKAPDKIDLNFYNKSDEEIDAEIAALESSINKVYVPPEALQPVSGNASENESDTESGDDENDLESTSALQPESGDTQIDSTESADPEIQEVLADKVFDPFNNIKND
jgi:hypothetical protein